MFSTFFSFNNFVIILIFGDRLCNNKQSKVYLPEPPFPHAEVSQGTTFLNFCTRLPVWAVAVDTVGVLAKVSVQS